MYKKNSWDTLDKLFFCQKDFLLVFQVWKFLQNFISFLLCLCHLEYVLNYRKAKFILFLKSFQIFLDIVGKLNISIRLILLNPRILKSFLAWNSFWWIKGQHFRDKIFGFHRNCFPNRISKFKSNIKNQKR